MCVRVGEREYVGVRERESGCGRVRARERAWESERETNRRY